jgi:hypothetical protein
MSGVTVRVYVPSSDVGSGGGTGVVYGKGCGTLVALGPGETGVEQAAARAKTMSILHTSLTAGMGRGYPVVRPTPRLGERCLGAQPGYDFW